MLLIPLVGEGPGTLLAQVVKQLLTNSSLEFPHLASAHNARTQRGSHPIAAQHGKQHIVMLHREAIQGNDGIIQEQPAMLGWAASFDLHHHQADSLAKL